MDCISRHHGNVKIKSHDHNNYPLYYTKNAVSLGNFQREPVVIHITCNMDTRDLSDIYALSHQGCSPCDQINPFCLYYNFYMVAAVGIISRSSIKIKVYC